MNAQAGMGAGGQNGAGNGDASGAGGVGGDGSGMGGASGGPAFDAADHCGPGEYVPPLDFARASGPNHAQSCVAQDFLAAGEAGVFDTMPALRPGIWSVELAAPMTADEPYSFSIEIEFRGVEGAMRYELWGTNARCGAESTAIKLAELPLAVTKQVLCLDVTPAEAYSHMLIVTRDIDDVPPTDRQLVALNGAMFCADGSCP